MDLKFTACVCELWICLRSVKQWVRGCSTLFWVLIFSPPPPTVAHQQLQYFVERHNLQFANSMTAAHSNDPKFSSRISFTN